MTMLKEDHAALLDAFFAATARAERAEREVDRLRMENRELRSIVFAEGDKTIRHPRMIVLADTAGDGC